MSTCAMVPRPDQAMPRISIQPGSTTSGYAGAVISERASKTKLNCRAVPSSIGSVYFEVSSRVMNG